MSGFDRLGASCCRLACGYRFIVAAPVSACTVHHPVCCCAEMATEAIMGVQQADPHKRYQLAGLGFGLPMARLHARYFGGELTLVNLERYGVDAYISLPALDACEWEESTTVASVAGIV
jgi:hypothetical protein